MADSKPQQNMGAESNEKRRVSDAAHSLNPGLQFGPAYVLAGTVHVDAGASGKGTIQASAGDLVYIEPATVHRERYGEGALATVGFYFGSGPGRVEVDGPDRG